jgi:hypothetical protein
MDDHYTVLSLPAGCFRALVAPNAGASASVEAPTTRRNRNTFGFASALASTHAHSFGRVAIKATAESAETNWRS